MGDNKDTIDVAELLTEYQADYAAVVKDSCTVALDIMKYWYVERSISIILINVMLLLGLKMSSSTLMALPININ
jgi:hypothetical protein